MFELTVKVRDRVVSRHKFDQDVVRIGRSPDSEVHVDNPVFSRAHAVIRRQGPVFTLDDLDTVNGTFVNGKRVKSWNLSKGDLISIGKFTVAFWCDPPKLEVQDIAVDGGGTISIAPRKESAPALEDKAALRAHLEQIGQRRAYKITKDVFLIGAHEQADLKVEGWFAPARVAVIARGLGGFALVNVAGKGVRLNNSAVKLKAWLSEGDVIEVGGSSYTFHRGTHVEAGAEPR